jgi:hypothetical protein
MSSFHNVTFCRVSASCDLISPTIGKVTGADFSKFQGMLRFALQILADNLKGFKTQLTAKCQHQEHKE